MRAVPTFLLAAATLSSQIALAEPVSSLRPPPRGSWIVDRTGKLSPEALRQVNAVAAELDASGAGQLGVAMIHSTDGRDTLAYATELSNQWGVGHAGRDDGALLLVALNDRKMAIALGSGVDDDEAVRATSRIIDEVMKPEFRAGRFDEGVVRAAESVAQLLRSIDGQAAEPTAAPLTSREEPVALVRPRHAWVIDLEGGAPEGWEQALNAVSWEMEAEGETPIVWITSGVARLARRGPAVVPELGAHWQVVMVPRTGAVTIRPPEGAVADPEAIAHAERAWSQAFGTALQVTDLAERTRTLTRTGRFPRPATEIASEVASEHKGTLAGGGLLSLLAGAFGLRRYLRYRPRHCDRCGSPRQRLDEQWDDPHLTDGQRREEELKSVDYDVWWCALCSDAQVIAHRAWLSGFKRCDACQQITVKHTTRTIQHANYDRGGIVEVTEDCKHCPHRKVYQRHTARLTRSSSSRSSFGSSSRGSSFGGGRSSGRGSSGGW